MTFGVFVVLTSSNYSDQHGYECVPHGIKNYIYSSNTGNANLRRHLMREHEAAYKQKCRDEGWDYTTPKVPQPSVGVNRQNALPSFSPEVFLEYLVRFVTADDQVSISLETIKVLIF